MPKPKKQLDFNRYQRLWQGWFRGNSGQTWGQYVANGFNILEEDAPGLHFASNVSEANRIIKQYCNLV